MYLDYFGLQTDPFRLDPNLDFVYVSKSHEETLAHLVYGIEQGEDFVLITGGIGTGKTLALHFLLDQIVSSYRTAFVNVTTISFLELLKMILDDLEVDFERSWDRADLLATLKRYLGSTRQQREKVLVVVDEAQNLEPETLEGLRLLSNLSQPGDQVLQIILVGQPGLVELVDMPELEQLKQRIRVHYELEKLSREEVEEYLKHRMNVSGGDGEIFSRDAIDRINRFSGGVPRLVNQFAGKALLSAFVEESKTVRGIHVEREESEPKEDMEKIVDVEETTAAPEPDEIPEAPRRVLKSSQPRSSASSSSGESAINPPNKSRNKSRNKPRKNPPKTTAKNETETSRKKPPLVEEALSSIEDVDLDAIRDARHHDMATRKGPRESKQKSGSGKGRLWAACLVVAIGASLYFTGGWQWLTESIAGKEEATRSVAQAEVVQVAENSANPDDVPPVSSEPIRDDAEPSDQLEREVLPVEDSPVETQDDEVIIEPVDTVVVTTPTENTAAVDTPIPAPATEKPQVLHVASFRAASQATNLIEKLKTQGVDGYVKDQKVNGTTWYRVYLGPFPDIASATSVGQDLKEQRAVMYYRLLENDE